jgi:N-dimethylarginine dimethylaminohydrolase
LLPHVSDEVGRIKRILLRHAEHAFVDKATIADRWQALNYLGPPDFASACAEYQRFTSLIEGFGITVEFLPTDDRLGLDAIYVRDASVVAPGGMVIANMGKPARAAEPMVAAEAFGSLGIAIKGSINGDGRLEGGDVVWLDAQTVAVGHGYRTNAEGIRQYAQLLGEDIEMLVVPLPHWKGPQDVFHLMSILSPLDGDLALVYSPLLPVPFREALLARNIRFVEVPTEEFESLGCNVLTIAPRCCVVLAGNPRTRAALEREGVEVHEFQGKEISLKGGGGPTCLTLPIVRD